MAVNRTSRAKSRGNVAKAKATRKSSVQTTRKAPKVGKGTFPPEYIEIF